MILFPARSWGDRIMRGEDERSGSLFSYVDLEARIDRGHPLRMIRLIVTRLWRRSAAIFRR